ncbi:glycosyltransferase [Corynebacterium sp. 13CS0277]|nr:glycosyltransferase [Corynebacterium sp. 13CS0277]
MPAPTRPRIAPPLSAAQWLLVACGIGLGFTVWALVVNYRLAAHGFLMDLQVFQDAARAFRTDGPLFEGFYSRSGFGFIYPPFAALVMSPLAYVPQTPLRLAWNFGQVVCVFIIVSAGLALGGFGRRTAMFLGLCLLGVALSAEPIDNGMGFGQIDTYLAMLVIADVAGVLPHRLRGLGVGLAAGIKVTPAAFGLVFLIRRDWAAAARAVAMGLVTLIVGWLVRAEDSLHFWTVEMWNTDRAGQKDFFRNQALSGLIAREIADPNSTLFLVLWGAGVVLLGGLGLWAMVTYSRKGHPLLSLAMFVFMLCLLQPYAVTHHWAVLVLWVPVVVTLFADKARLRWWALAFGLVQWWGPNHLLDPDKGYAAWQHALGESQSVTLIIATVVLALAARGVADRHPADRRY